MKARRLIENEWDDKDEVLVGHLAAEQFTQVDGDFGDPWLYGGAWLSGDGNTVIYQSGAEDWPGDADDPEMEVPVYRFHVESELEPWINEAAIKRTCGMSDEEWSEMPMYAKWINVGRYHGFDNLDGDPRNYTKARLSGILGIDL